MLPSDLLGLREALGGGHTMPIARQRSRDELGDFLVIFDDKHPHGTRGR